MVFARTLSVAIGLMLGGGASQLPEYAQQYRQRLGGAIDELKTIVAAFDRDSKAGGMTREGGLDRLRASDDGFVRARGAQMQETIARTGRLELQQRQLASAGAFSRVTLMLRDFDPGVAHGAWANFEPALPVTSEGVGAGLIGFLGGGALFHVAGTPFRRRKRVVANV